MEKTTQVKTRFGWQEDSFMLEMYIHIDPTTGMNKFANMLLTTKRCDLVPKGRWGECSDQPAFSCDGSRHCHRRFDLHLPGPNGLTYLKNLLFQSRQTELNVTNTGRVRRIECN